MARATFLVPLLFLALLAAALAACTPEARMVIERPPIEEVRIDIPASDEPATLVVVWGRRNVCVEPRRFTVTREGDTFTAEAVVFAPKHDDPKCGSQYSTGVYRSTLLDKRPLPGSLGPVEACKVYTVVLNGETHQVPATGPGVDCPPA